MNPGKVIFKELIYDEKLEVIGLSELDPSSISVKFNSFGKKFYYQYEGTESQKILHEYQILVSYQ